MCFPVIVTNAPVRADDPHPPQLNVTFLAQPAPIIQNGSTRLYYEMVITNFARSNYLLEEIQTSASGIKSRFDGQVLAQMIHRLGAGKQEQRADRKIEGSAAVIVFLGLDLGKDESAGTIEQTLRILDENNETHDVVLAPLKISDEAPIVVAPPLRGEWIAGDSAGNHPDAAHRRAVLVDNGRAWLAQRFAIDWVQYQTVVGRRT
jgi:hypothetical protein